MLNFELICVKLKDFYSVARGAYSFDVFWQAFNACTFNQSPSIMHVERTCCGWLRRQSLRMWYFGSVRLGFV